MPIQNGWNLIMKLTIGHIKLCKLHNTNCCPDTKYDRTIAKQY